jgi:hypothetical protein
VHFLRSSLALHDRAVCADMSNFGGMGRAVFKKTTPGATSSAKEYCSNAESIAFFRPPSSRPHADVESQGLTPWLPPGRR